MVVKDAFIRVSLLAGGKDFVVLVAYSMLCHWVLGNHTEHAAIELLRLSGGNSVH